MGHHQPYLGVMEASIEKELVDTSRHGFGFKKLQGCAIVIPTPKAYKYILYNHIRVHVPK